MGVSGSGKTTLGRALATCLAAETGHPWTFEDADAFHTPDALARMSRGEALTDADRAPWLARLADLLRERIEHGPPTVLACSALRADHRRTLTRGNARVATVWLDAPADVLAARLGARTGHAVGPSLLPSQLATLEPPGGDVLRLDAREPPERLAETAAAFVLGRAGASGFPS